MKPEFAVVNSYSYENRKVVAVDTSKARYQGHTWHGLNETYKRKFENLLFLSHAQMGEPVKVIYI